MSKVRILEVYKNTSGNGFRFLGAAYTLGSIKKIIADNCGNATLQELSHNEYYDQNNETIYRVK